MRVCDVTVLCVRHRACAALAREPLEYSLTALSKCLRSVAAPQRRNVAVSAAPALLRPSPAARRPRGYSDPSGRTLPSERAVRESR
jgi:hypothetical protein